jgi:hypothetical protein
MSSSWAPLIVSAYLVCPLFTLHQVIDPEECCPCIVQLGSTKSIVYAAHGQVARPERGIVCCVVYCAAVPSSS